jgi:hypothetical protein
VILLAPLHRVSPCLVRLPALTMDLTEALTVVSSPKKPKESGHERTRQY